MKKKKKKEKKKRKKKKIEKEKENEKEKEEVAAYEGLYIDCHLHKEKVFAKVINDDVVHKRPKNVMEMLRLMTKVYQTMMYRFVGN